MAYLTMSAARSAAGAVTTQMAEKSLRASAAAATDASFDIFLSHCVKDAPAIEGVRQLLVGAGLSVYVDWIEDPHLSRASVTAATAAKLRERMRNSRALIFATSESSPTSKWMPWELGYFDGLRPMKVAILPLVASAVHGFVGQEYLGLYPALEDIGVGLPRLGLPIQGGRLMDVPSFVREGAYLAA